MFTHMESSSFKTIDPVKPIASYIGGKHLLSRRLARKISDIDHVTYAEPFIGMGGVFFKRFTKPAAEVINDINNDISNLFRILQRHYPQFLDTIKFQITSRAEFNRLVDTNPDTLTDLERAARFLYLQRTAFGGKISGRNFGVSIGYSARFNLTTLEPMLEAVHERLSGVIIENLDWKAFIERYDRPTTLFYLDPPWFGNENDYGKGIFSQDQFEVMAEILSKIKGRFILSINNQPEIAKIFKAFHQEPVELIYTIKAKGKPKPARELIITH